MHFARAVLGSTEDAWGKILPEQAHVRYTPPTLVIFSNQIGDDTIQRRTQGYVVPDSFTHGTSQQRMQWFSRGMQAGDMRQCDTFR
jgi:predicted metalloprotease